MKFLIASDIHGSAVWCRKFVDAVRAQHPDKILLLGDILYHGPRNDLPEGYNPKEVIDLLNPLADQIIAVRGNCDAEVDQMVLDFPCMADYATILDPEYIDENADFELQTARTLFLTHGHVYGPDKEGAAGNLPKVPVNTALVYGHTHRKVNEPCAEDPIIWLFNPGSLSLPKDGSHSYGVYTSGLPIEKAFQHVVLE